MLLGLHGHAGVGKHAAARALVEHADFRTFAITAPVRRILTNLDPPLRQGWTVSSLIETHGWRGGLRHPFHGAELRRSMVVMGRSLRETFGDGVLLGALETELLEQFGSLNPANRNVVVTDVRLEHEASWVLRHGGIVLALEQTGARPASTDVTEQPLPDSLVSFTIRAGSDDEIANLVLETVREPDQTISEPIGVFA